MNTLVFINGPSGRGPSARGTSGSRWSDPRLSGPEAVALPPKPRLQVTAVNTPKVKPPEISPQPVASAEPSVESRLLQFESKTLDLRLQQLRELRRNLPEQVRQATGVETLRLRHEEASRQLDEMNALSREVAVLCPAYGTVGEVRFQQGDTLPAGEIMLTVLHMDRRFVMIHVPSRRVNELKPGASAELIFPGGERFSGTIAELPMRAEISASDCDSTATVRVEPSGKLWPSVPIGTQIDVVLRR